MPSEKRFESFNLSTLSTEYKDMFESAEIFYDHIKRVLQYLDEGKQVVFEVPNEENLYRMIKTDNGSFKYKVNSSELRNLEPIEVLNLIFEKAPYISVVGEENGPL